MVIRKLIDTPNLSIKDVSANIPCFVKTFSFEFMSLHLSVFEMNDSDFDKLE